MMIVAVVLSLTVVSCKDNNPYSGDHLSSKMMQKVMLDINLAESYSSIEKDSLHKHGEKNLDSLSAHYRDIFAHYKITKEQFIESLNWYKNHSDVMDTLYANMMPVVTKWQEKNAKPNP